MRKRKAIINSSVNLITFFVTFIPNLFIRRLFLNSLGEDLLGLSSLYTNIIGWLSIVELGVGTAIIFSLYKPYKERHYSQIRAYLKFYKKFYWTVGGIILTLGLLLTPFIQFFIENQYMDKTIIQVGFLLFLINSFVTYLFSSRLCILTVAEEGYIISIGTTLTKLFIFLIQFIILCIYPNFLLFSGVQIIVNIVFYLIINKYIENKYSWINQGNESLVEGERIQLIRSVRAMFLHKIGALVVFSTDSLVISKFVGLANLAQYTNYQTIISAAEKLLSTALQGITASVGNMLTDCNPKYASEIHKKIFFINFWVTSFITIALFNTLNQFVVIWLGEKYLLDSLTFIVILINFYFILMRGSIERFKEASGNYIQDRYAPLIEALVNLIFSVILVKRIGLAGVFIGTLISNFTILFWIQPYVVYKFVFEEKLINYFKMYLKYALITIMFIILTHILTFNFKYKYDILNFIINCLVNVIVVNGLYLVIFHKKEEFQYFYNIIKKK